VREDERAWEGAAERLLHAFGDVQAGVDLQHAQANASLAMLVEKLSQARSLLAESETLATAIDDAMRATTLPALEALREQALGEHTLTVESCDNRERDMREFVQARIDADSKRIATLRDRIITAMQDYATTWPLDARKVDVSADLRDFQQDLRSCTEGALTGPSDEEYTEAKFLQVRRIIERFRGREGSAAMDRRWTRKVTDVRKGLIAELLDQVLPAESIDAGAIGARQFEACYGLLGQPAQIRFRILDGRHTIGSCSDLMVPVAQFAALHTGVDRAFITENEVNALAFPDVESSMVVFGAGYGIDRLAQVDCLRSRRHRYPWLCDPRSPARIDPRCGIAIDG